MAPGYGGGGMGGGIPPGGGGGYPPGGGGGYPNIPADLASYYHARGLYMKAFRMTYVQHRAY